MTSTEPTEKEAIQVEIKPHGWQKLVWDRYGGVCGNCGGTSHLSARLIVPVASGGLETPSNGVLLCRPCDLASSAISSATPPETRLVNFWVSNELYKFMQGPTGFSGMGTLIRALLDKFIEDPDRFDDLAQYQDEGSDVKVNVWVDIKKYTMFRKVLEKNNMTITQALKSLIKMYQLQTEEE